MIGFPFALTVTLTATVNGVSAFPGLLVCFPTAYGSSLSRKLHFARKGGSQPC